MSLVTKQPEMPAATVAKSPNIGSAMTAGKAAAAVPTTGAVFAAVDEVIRLARGWFRTSCDVAPCDGKSRRA